MRRTAVLVSVLVLAGCGGDDEPDDGGASDFLTQRANEVTSGQYRRAWESLHPAHQRVIDAARFVDCYEQWESDNASAIPDDFRMEPVETFKENVQLEGVGEVDSTAVTFEISGGGQTIRDTAHVVLVDGNWRWMLTPEDYRQAVAGECPDFG